MKNKLIKVIKMKVLDFLSESPRNFIFQKEVNKTNFGGVLFLFYSIIMIIIILTYLLDYYLNEKYEIEYKFMLNQTLTSDLPTVNQNPDLNPTLEFSILLNADKLEKLGYIPDNFKLISLKPFEIIDQNYRNYSRNHKGYLELYFPLNSTVSDYQVLLAYTCGGDPNCTFEEGIKTNSYDKKF